MKLFISYLISAMVFACSSPHTKNIADHDMALMAEPAMGNEQPVAKEVQSSEEQVQEPVLKIIREANIGFEVKDYYKTRSALDTILRKYQAYLVNESENHSNVQLSNSITIRVESKYFDELLANIGALPGRFEYKNITAQDVTEEYIDVEGRLKTKREAEKRYYEILKQAKTIKEVLEVETELRKLREEIESVEGRLRYLQNRVNYSTVYLNFYQKFAYQYEPELQKNIFERLIRALHTGWKGLVGVFVGLFYVWPLFLLAAIALLLIKYFRKKKKRNKTT